MVVLQLAVRAAVACDAAALRAEIEAADRALAVLDVPAFDAAVDRTLAEVGCASEAIEPKLAAAVHEVVGLRAFGLRDPSAGAAFAAARRTDPSRASPGERFPAVASAWAEIAAAEVPTESLPAPVEGWLTVDGSRATERPAGLPTVLQWVHADGTIGASAYLAPGAPVDLYPVVAPPAPEPPPRPRGRTAVAVTAAAAGVVAASTWAWSLDGRARYLDLDDPVPDDRLDGLRARTNALAATSLGAAAVCAASGVALVVRW